MRFGLENIFEFKQLLRHLSAGLERLSFRDNFEGFEAILVIPANTEIKVRNQLKFIPTKYIITNQKGNGLVTAGDTTWTTDFIYIKNHGSNQVNVTLQFLR